MSYIPNVREKMSTTPFAKEPRENEYWEGNLDENGKHDLAVYDYAVENMHLFFYNADVYPGIEGVDLGLVRECLADWMETERNELVVSMLDNQASRE